MSVAVLSLSAPLVVLAAGPGAAAGAVGAPPILVHVSLPSRPVVAGHPIKGTASLTNTTDTAITVDTCALDGWLAVGLQSPTYRASFPHYLVGCAPSVHIRPGVNRYPVTVLTSYGGCAQPQPSGSSPSIDPTCVVSDGRDVPPPLPAGRYRTTVDIVGLTGKTQPANRVVVTLRAPATPPKLAPCAATPTTAPTLVTVPDVVGESSSIAAFAFAGACLNAAWASPVGTRVVSESPAAGSKVAEYSTVTVTTR